MKIQILSDLHLEGGIPFLLKNFQPVGDVLVLAGDITSSKRVGKVEEVFGHLTIPVIYIMGNHEYYGDSWYNGIDKYQQWLKDKPNFHVVENKTVTIDGVSFICATYWNDVTLYDEPDVKKYVNDFKAISGCSVSKQREHHHASKQYIKSELQRIRQNSLGKSVVVTHFAPSYLAQEERFKSSGLGSYFYNRDDELIELEEPDLWIYGHTHGNLRFNIGKTFVTTNQLGYVQGSFDRLRVEPCYETFDLNYVVEL